LTATEFELVSRAQNGCIQSFEALIRPLDRKMLSLAASLANNPDDAEEVYQEAMLTAFKKLGSFKMQSQFSTWLYRVVVNTAISLRRKLKSKINSIIFNQSSFSQSSLSSADSEGMTESHYEQFTSGDSRLEPESRLINAQLSQAISDGLVQLSERERLAFSLCHQQELKISEASWIMQCSEGAIKNFLFRARQKMQCYLQDYR